MTSASSRIRAYKFVVLERCERIREKLDFLVGLDIVDASVISPLVKTSLSIPRVNVSGQS